MRSGKNSFAVAGSAKQESGQDGIRTKKTPREGRDGSCFSELEAILQTDREGAEIIPLLWKP